MSNEIIKDFPYYNKISEPIDYNYLNFILDHKYKYRISFYPINTIDKFEKLLYPIINRHNYCFIKLNYFENKLLNSIADYFTEPCRIYCLTDKINNKTIAQYFLDNEDFLYKTYNNNLYAMRSFIYKQIKSCTNFNITMGLTILQLFQPKVYIDISSGWGDRLVMSIAYSILERNDSFKLYLGTDPNKNLAPYYNKIIETLSPDKNKFRIIMDGFLETDHDQILSEYNLKCDLIFSSPPFFDIEIYSKFENDSLIKNTTLDQWIDNFLNPVIKKSYNLLELEGHLILYIEDRADIQFIDNMIKYAISIGFKYIGPIYYYYIDTPSKYRKIYVFKKTA